MDRATAEEINEANANPNGRIVDFLRTRATGWLKQDLVIDTETNQPADFDKEAFDVLMSFAGLPAQAWLSYLAEVGAKEKNS